MVDGPLPAKGLSTVPKYWGSRAFHGERHGQLRRQCTLGWKARMDSLIATHLMVDTHDSDTSGGSLASSEPWKASDVKTKMILLRLRVMETPNQLAAFGGTPFSVR